MYRTSEPYTENTTDFHQTLIGDSRDTGWGTWSSSGSDYQEDLDDEGNQQDNQYYTDDSWSSASGSPVIGTGRDPSPSPPIRDGGSFIPTPRELFTDSSRSKSRNSSEKCNSSEKRKTFPSLYFIILTLIFGATLMTVTHNNHKNITEPDYPSILPPAILPPPPINWWERYNDRCCVYSNQTAIYGRSDCTADGTCYNYLESWLLDHNQTFYNSSWSNKCCYEYRPIGSKYYSTYCSYTCLNTARNKWVRV